MLGRLPILFFLNRCSGHGHVDDHQPCQPSPLEVGMSWPSFVLFISVLLCGFQMGIDREQGVHP